MRPLLWRRSLFLQPLPSSPSPASQSESRSRLARCFAPDTDIVISGHRNGQSGLEGFGTFHPPLDDGGVTRPRLLYDPHRAGEKVIREAPVAHIAPVPATISSKPHMAPCALPAP